MPVTVRHPSPLQNLCHRFAPDVGVTHVVGQKLMCYRRCCSSCMTWTVSWMKTRQQTSQYSSIALQEWLRQPQVSLSMGRLHGKDLHMLCSQTDVARPRMTQLIGDRLASRLQGGSPPCLTTPRLLTLYSHQNAPRPKNATIPAYA